MRVIGGSSEVRLGTLVSSVGPRATIDGVMKASLYMACQHFSRRGGVQGGKDRFSAMSTTHLDLRYPMKKHA
jgi:hypothetical protein